MTHIGSQRLQYQDLFGWWRLNRYICYLLTAKNTVQPHI